MPKINVLFDPNSNDILIDTIVYKRADECQSNAVLAQTIADLTRDVSTLNVQLKNMTDERDYFKNGMAELQDYIDKIEPENVELKVQVEQLRLAALNAISFMAGGEAKAKLRDAYDATPAQCLAEHDREVAARAAKAGFVAGFTYCYEQDCEPLAGLAESANYANKIKSGEVKL